MFYWDAERFFFEEDGGRKDRKVLQDDVRAPSMLLIAGYVVNNNPLQWQNTTKELQFRAYHERGQGTYPTTAENRGQ